MSGDNDLVWFLGMIGLLAFLWFVSGGPGSAPSGGSYIPAGGTKEIGQSLDGIEKEVKDIEGSLKAEADRREASPYKGQVSFYGSWAGQETAPAREYLAIKAAPGNKEKIAISGWKLESLLSGASDYIGKGAELPYSGIINSESAIFLGPGEIAYITTGRSPIGVSFKLNVCSGYFEQFQDFTPSLPRECPLIEDEPMPAAPNSLDDKCLDFIERLPRCEFMTSSPPLYLSSQCVEFIGENAGYNSCVDNHKGRKGFYKSEWRIFLKRDSELWKQKREVIRLTDQNGKTVDSVSY